MRTSVVKLIAVGLIVAAGLAPGAASAQSTNVQSCGLDLPITGDQVMLQQPDDLGVHDQGMINYSGVRGSIVHMAGPLALVQIEGMGTGNATSNQELAGNNMAVVKLPDECNPSDFSAGMPIMAIGTPTEQGILDAVVVSPS
jgi:hypothetical protein